MTSMLVDLAEEIIAAIEEKNTSGTPAWDALSQWTGTTGFVIDKIDIERSYLPKVSIPELPADAKGAKIWIIGLGADDGAPETRKNLSQKRIPIQIGIQGRVNPDDKAAMDLYVEFEEQVREVIRRDVDIRPNMANYSWTANEFLRDNNGTPYSFVGLRETSCFEAYFTSYFLRVMK